MVISPYHLFLAITPSILFATASLFFSYYSRQVSPLWMNFIKVFIAQIGFVITVLIFKLMTPLSVQDIALMMLSGFVGLFLGDYFLFKSYVTLGPSRTLVLFGFKPVILAYYGHVFINQSLSKIQAMSVLALLGCLYFFAQERRQEQGQWEWMPLAVALLGITLDCFGVIFSREVYETHQELHPMYANVLRIGGALMGFIGLRLAGKMQLFRPYWRMERRHQITLAIVCFFGTFVSLSFYLTAIKYTHLTIMAALGITGPLWITLLESFRSRNLPGKYYFLAMSCFALGLVLLLY